MRNSVLGGAFWSALGWSLMTSCQLAAAEAPASAHGDRQMAVVANCPSPATYSGPDKASAGDRAIISADGNSFVLQCADGGVHSWSATAGVVESLGRVTLFEAAQAKGILPSDLVCPSELGPNSGFKPDCDVVDSVGDTYILRDGVGPGFIVRRGARQPVRKLSNWQEPGVLYPRTGKPKQAIVANRERIPNTLQTLDIESGRTLREAKLPSKNMIFEEGEGQPSDVTYSRAHDFLMIGYTGVFRAARDMTYIRAFLPSGIEVWRVKRKLQEEGRGFAGDVTRLRLASSGRFAALASTSDRSVTVIYDAAKGREVGRLKGWLLDAATDAGRLLVRTDDNHVALLSWPPKAG